MHLVRVCCVQETPFVSLFSVKGAVQTENRYASVIMVALWNRADHYICLSNALDRPSNQFFPSVSQSVCVFVNRSVVERLRPQFFTDFHEILHAAQKCGRFVAYCL